jgi:hypothetical protein
MGKGRGEGTLCVPRSEVGSRESWLCEWSLVSRGTRAVESLLEFSLLAVAVTSFAPAKKRPFEEHERLKPELQRRRTGCQTSTPAIETFG